MSDRKKVLRIVVTAGILAVLYILLIMVAPGLSVWTSSHKINYSGRAADHEISAGDSYSTVFVMPCDVLRSVDIHLDSNGSPNVVRTDILVSLQDNSGNVVASGNITSAYDSILDTGRLRVQQGGNYVLNVTVKDAGGEGKAVRAPVVKTDAGTGNILFEVNGTGTGSSAKMLFAAVYVIFGAMVMLYVYNLDKSSFGECAVSDRVIIGVLVCASVFMICQYYDLFMIIKSALRMLDSFKAGNFTDYYGYSYLSELGNQSNKMLFAYEYNFFQIFFTLILILPLSLFMDGNFYGGGIEGLFAVMYLSVVMTVLLFVAVKLIGRIFKACGMNDGFTRASKLLFISSPMLLYISIGYGQIDIMYMIVIICALPFYYSGRYYAFSAVMSLAVAMKTLPLFIFFPLLLLAVKKVKDILINTVIVMVLPVLTHVIFERSAYHGAISRIIEEDYSYVSRLADVRLGDVVSLFIASFAAVCVICYLRKTDTGNRMRMLFESQLAIAAVYAAFIIFVNWHLQWMIPLVLSVSILIPMIKANKNILIIDIAAESLFIATACFMGTSSNQVNFGLLPLITGEYSDAPEITVIMRNLSPITAIAVRSCLAAVLVTLIVLMFRNRNSICDGTDQEAASVDRRYVIGRTGVLYLLILFFCWTFFYIG